MRFDAFPPQSGTHRRTDGLRNLETVPLHAPHGRDTARRGRSRALRQRNRHRHDPARRPSVSPGLPELFRRRAERLRIGLPQEQERRHVHRQGRVHLVRKSRREDDAAGRPDARHRIVGGAGLRSARREGRYAGPHPRGVDHRFGAGRRLRAAPHAACDHFALVRRRGRRADLALLHRSRYRRCGRSGQRREVVPAAAPERPAGGAPRRRPLPASSGRIEKT